MSLKNTRRGDLRRQSKQRCRTAQCSRLGLAFESLESRRLLVSEGETYSLVRDMETLGLGGTLSAAVAWGDGTSSNAVVSGGVPNGRVHAKIDYSLDSRRFFTAERKAILEAVVDSVLSRLDDALTAITPGGANTWTIRFTHPETESEHRIKDVSVAANELLIFAGSRPIPGAGLAEGGPGGYIDVTGTSQAFLNAVQSRGQGNVSGPSANDFGPWGGTLAFDSTEDWYFGADPTQVPEGKADFATAAAHELMHLLGFGLTDSWTRLVSGNTFTGPASKAAYDGSGNVPLLVGNLQHWARDLVDDGHETLMDPDQLRGQRKSPTKLDYAGLDDIGWVVIHPKARVTASHVYPDNGSYPIGITLQGSTLGKTSDGLNVTISNSAPTIELVAPQSIVAGQSLSITNMANITDLGFRNTAADPPTVETFSYTVDWRDGSAPSAGTATIDQQGNSTRPTLASFNASHVYTTPGTYRALVRVTDDDGGTTSGEVVITVQAPPTITITSNRSRFREDGSQPTSLTLRRQGGDTSQPLTVQLTSSDTSEATVPGTVEFAANQLTRTISIEVVDDTLLDGDQPVTFTVGAVGITPASVDVVVADVEFLSAEFSVPYVIENAGVGAAPLRVTRSNTDSAQPVTVNLRGGDATLLTVPLTITIPSGQRSVTVAFDAVDDFLYEPTKTVTLTVTATGYTGAEATIQIRDDEPPFFQNQVNPLDVDGDGTTRPIDALKIINLLNRSGGLKVLDALVDAQTPFFDVSGDYVVTPIDALRIINALNRGEAEGENINVNNSDPTNEIILVGPLDVDSWRKLSWHWIAGGSLA